MPDATVLDFAPRDRRTTKRRPRPSIPAGTPLPALIDSWKLALTAANRSDNTIRLYLRTARLFVDYLDVHGDVDDAESVTADHVRAFLISERERAGLPTAACHHAYLSVWFNWIISEEERTTFSPVRKADKPHVQSKAYDYLTPDELVALLNACKGTGFAERRDTAVILIFIDNGMRVSGLSGLKLGDVDLSQRQLRIRLKGGKEHWTPIGAKTAQALDRYLRVRARHPSASEACLWLSERDRMKPWFRQRGIADMLHRRGEQAGVENVHPHRFRGSSAHQMLNAGANPDAVRRILGWKSEAMLRHYTEELADERARAVHAQFSPSDRL